MRVLVAYASTHGSTGEIAEAIADHLRCVEVFATVRSAAKVRSIADYDAFVVGSAVYFGRWLPAARTLAQRCVSEVPDLPLWRFSSGPLSDTPPSRSHLSLVRGSSRPVADRAVVFGGKLPDIGLDDTERSLVALAGFSTADYRQWDDIREWALRVRAELVSASSPSSRGNRREAAGPRR